MVAFNRFFASVFLAIVCSSSGAFAAPLEPSAKLATHRVRSSGSAVPVEAYHPASTYQVRFSPPSQTIVENGNNTII